MRIIEMGVLLVSQPQCKPEQFNKAVASIKFYDSFDAGVRSYKKRKLAFGEPMGLSPWKLRSKRGWNA